MNEPYKFFRICRDSKLLGLNDPIGDVPLLGKSLKAIQDERIAIVSGKLSDRTDSVTLSYASSPGYFTFDERELMSSDFLKFAIQRSNQSKKNLKFHFEENRFNRRFLLGWDPSQGEKYKSSLQWIARPNDPNFESVRVPQKIYFSATSIPRTVVSHGEWSYDQCSTYAGLIASPFHLLQLNLAELFARAMKLRTWMPHFLDQWLFKTHSPTFFWGLRRINRIGKRSKIHPTATLEGVTLGDDCTIGAHAVVRMSHLGSGCTVDENTVVKYSVLGDGTYIACGNQVNGCMTYENVFLIHGPYQFSIFGKNSTVMAVINCDIRLDGKTIKIPTDYGLIDSQQELMGIAYGHNTKIGAGNMIAAGRIVPNNKILLPPSSIILSP